MAKPVPLEDKPTRRCRKWQLRVSLGKDPVTGKYKTKTKVFSGSYREAEKELARFSAGAKMTKASGMTFNECADAWLEYRDKYYILSPSTVKSSKANLRAFSFHVGDMPIENITADDIQVAITRMMDGVTLSGRNVLNSSILKYASCSKSMFSWAVKRGYVMTNPFDSVDLPKAERRERRSLTEEECERLIEWCTPPDRFKIGVLMCLMAGLRRGEAVNMKWGDISGSNMMVRGTKTAASNALIPIAPRLVDALNEYKSIAERDGYPVGDDYTVMCDIAGIPMKGGSFLRWWSFARVRAGVGKITIHELRHTHATRLARRGVHPAVMQSLLRHSDPSITLGIYTHINTIDSSNAVKDL